MTFTKKSFNSIRENFPGSFATWNINFRLKSNDRRDGTRFETFNGKSIKYLSSKTAPRFRADVSPQANDQTCVFAFEYFFSKVVSLFKGDAAPRETIKCSPEIRRSNNPVPAYYLYINKLSLSLWSSLPNRIYQFLNPYRINRFIQVLERTLVSTLWRLKNAGLNITKSSRLS